MGSAVAKPLSLIVPKSREGNDPGELQQPQQEASSRRNPSDVPGKTDHRLPDWIRNGKLQCVPAHTANCRFIAVTEGFSVDSNQPNCVTRVLQDNKKQDTAQLCLSFPCQEIVENEIPQGGLYPRHVLGVTWKREERGDGAILGLETTDLASSVSGDRHGLGKFWGVRLIGANGNIPSGKSGDTLNVTPLDAPDKFFMFIDLCHKDDCDFPTLKIGTESSLFGDIIPLTGLQHQSSVRVIVRSAFPNARVEIKYIGSSSYAYMAGFKFPPRETESLPNSSIPIPRVTERGPLWARNLKLDEEYLAGGFVQRSEGFTVGALKTTVVLCGSEDDCVGTDGARWWPGFTAGRHVLEVTWNKEDRGSHATIGLATVDSPLWEKGRVGLVGRSDHPHASWGLDLEEGKVIYNFQTKTTFSNLDVPNTFFLFLDLDSDSIGLGFDDGWTGPLIHLHDRPKEGSTTVQSQASTPAKGNLYDRPMEGTTESRLLPLYMTVGCSEPGAIIEVKYRGSACEDGFDLFAPLPVDEHVAIDMDTAHSGFVAVSNWREKCSCRCWLEWTLLVLISPILLVLAILFLLWVVLSFLGILLGGSNRRD